MGKFSPRPPTPIEIKAYRNERECGLIEARNTLHRESVLHALSNVSINGTLEDKVDFLLEQFGKTLK